MPGIAFKPYACGTMTQPYIDCAVALAGRGVDPEEIVEIVCEVGEGTVHRLWEPLAVKQRPPTPYAAKFSTPFCVAAGVARAAGGVRAVCRGAGTRCGRARAGGEGPLRD